MELDQPVEKRELLVGITIDKFKGISPSTFLKLVRKLGLEFVEITESVFNEIEPFEAEVGGIKTGFHLPYWHDNKYDFSMASQEKRIRDKIALINQHAEKLNIIYCLSHPPEDSRAQSSWEQATDFLLHNLKQLKPPVILENVQGVSEEQFNRLFEKAKTVLGEKLIGQCFDAPHYFLSGQNPVSFIDQSNGRIKCVHLSDCKPTVDAHLAFGLGGALPIDNILSALKRIHFNGYINLELLPRSTAEIKQVINSYLKVVKVFSRKKHWLAKIRLLIYGIKLKRTVRAAFKQSQKAEAHQ